MKRAVVILAVLATLGLGAWAVWKLFPSDERKIRRIFNEVAATVSLRPNESNLVRLAKPAQLGRYFSREVSVRIESAGWGERTANGLEELEQGVRGAHATMQSVKVEFVDLVIEVSDDRQSATARLAAVVRVEGESQPNVLEFKVGLDGRAGDWRILKVESVRTLGGM